MPHKLTLNFINIIVRGQTLFSSKVTIYKLNEGVNIISEVS